MEEGMNWFGGMFTYDGMQRWQLWFDNPNKAAVILAQIAIVGLALFFARGRKRALVGLAMFMIPSMALVHTFSRGGIIAWLAGIAIIVLGKFHERIWRRRCAIAAVGVCIVLAMSCWLGLSRRMAYGLSGGDRSVGNRLELWSAAPRMLHDAPGGWGLGCSGDAYMDWYQPLPGRERYRTLVNSHLTWIVETGWLGFSIWTLVWGALLHWGFCSGRKGGRWTCLAELSCFFVAGAFSSVMESGWLWLIPGAVLVCEAGLGANRPLIRMMRSVRAVFVFGMPLIIVCFGASCLAYRDSRVSKRGETVRFDGAAESCWIVADESVLGGEHYPRVLREAAAELNMPTFFFVEHASAVPESVENLVLCGAADACLRRGTSRTVWMSPSERSPVVGGDVVIKGEFDDSDLEFEKCDVIEVPGTGRYIPYWPEILSSLVYSNDPADH